MDTKEEKILREVLKDYKNLSTFQLVKLLRLINQKPRNVWELIKYSKIWGMGIYVEDLIPKLIKSKLCKWKGNRLTLTEFSKGLIKEKKRREKINWNRILAMEKYLRKKFKKKREFEQHLIQPESVLKLVKFMDEREDVEEKRILCLGDDDFISLALAMTFLPERIAVVDIDERLLTLINKVSKKNSLGIETYECDLRKGLPENLKKRFDVVITNPPDTFLGKVLFTSKAIEFLSLKKDLKSGKVLYLGLGRSWMPYYSLLKLQRMFNQMGLVITDMLQDFLCYGQLPEDVYDFDAFNLPTKNKRILRLTPPKNPWEFVTLVRLITTEKTKPLKLKNVKGHMIYDYTLMKKYL